VHLCDQLSLTVASLGTDLEHKLQYWKNAVQQGLPFTMDPRVLYRGYGANTLNNGVCVMSQFGLNGMIKNAITGGTSRPLSDLETIGAGVGAGALSSVLCSPLELAMIQQQVKGTGFFSTCSTLVKGGPLQVARGTFGMMGREGLYCGGYMGLMPVVRRTIREGYPDSLGKTEDSARLAATCIAGPICAFFSHPPDTLKTCLQGDIERKKFSGYTDSAKTLIKERGISSLWAGMPWRLFRQCCAIFLFDKINTELSPILFPHAFEEKNTRYSNGSRSLSDITSGLSQN
jgi:hypothetical protein